jgi:hypothetical protein
VYVARGLLVESQSPTWLYGTSSEHAVYYQYNFNKARNIFAGMIQTESPYFQPTPKPPAPFEGVVGKFAGDPSYHCASGSSEFSGCDSSWAVLMRGCQDIFVAGAGLYSWFSTYTQDCSTYLPNITSPRRAALTQNISSRQARVPKSSDAP